MKGRTCSSSIRTSASTARSASPNVPAEAIFSEEDLPAGQQEFRALNADLSRAWPVITEKKPAPDDAKEWDGKPEKLALLER
jgi:ferredoxin